MDSPQTTTTVEGSNFRNRAGATQKRVTKDKRPLFNKNRIVAI